MNKHHLKRSLAAFLAFLMLLSVVTLPTFAAEASNIFFQEDFETKTRGDIFNSWSYLTAIQASKTNSSNTVAYLPFTGNSTNDYYLFLDNNNRTAFTPTSIETDSNGNVTVEGSATVGGVAYTFSGIVNTKNKTHKANIITPADNTKTLYVMTGALTDSFSGYIPGSNVAAPNKFNHAAWNNADVEDFVIDMNLYIPTGAKSTFATSIDGTRISDSKSVVVEMFYVAAYGNSATLTINGNSEFLNGTTSVSFPLGQWNRVSAVIDKETSAVSVYLNGMYAFSWQGKSTVTNAYGYIGGPINIKANSFFYQFNRNVALESRAGYAEVDNVTFYNSTENLFAPDDAVWYQDFESGMSIDKMFAQWASTLHVAKDALNPGNDVIQLDYKAAEDDGNYYLITSNNHWYAKISDYTIDENGILSGTATYGGITYTVKGKINTDGKTDQAELISYSAATSYKTLYIGTRSVADAYVGGINIARPDKFIHPKWSNANFNEYVIEMDVYIPVDARGEFATQVEGYEVSTGKTFAIQPFVINSSNSGVSLTKNSNQVYTAGTAVDYEVGRWNTVTSVINKSNAECTIYLNGEFAFTTKNTGSDTGYWHYLPTSAIDLNANTLLFQVNRGQKVSYYNGYAQIDNVAVYADEFSLDFATQIKHYNFETAEQDTKDEIGSGATTSAAVQGSQTDPSNKVFYMSAEPYDDGSYYLWLDKNTAGKIYGYEIGEDGKLQTAEGKTVTVNSVKYKIYPSTINHNSFATQADVRVVTDGVESATTTKLYVVTAALKDAFNGGGNIAKPFKIQSPAWNAADVEDFVISFDIFFAEGSRGTYSMIVSTTKALEPFQIILNGTKGTFKTETTVVSGGSKSISLGQWHNITIVIDKETSLFSGYLDGEFVVSTYCGLTAGSAINNLPANSFGMQYRRLTTPNNLSGYVELDNICYYTSTKSLKEKYFGEDFDTYTSKAGTAMNAGTTVHKGATFELDPCDPTNLVAKVPMDALVNNTPILLNINKSDLKYSKKYDITVSDGTVICNGYTVTENSDGTYNITAEGADTPTATNLKLTTLQEYYRYCGGDGAIDTNWKVVSEAFDYTTTPVVILSADYYIPTGAEGAFQGQLHSYKTNGTSKSWQALYQFNLSLGKVGIGDTLTHDIIRDAWNNISLKINLVTGEMNLYVNGSAAGFMTMAPNVTINANAWNFAKIMRGQAVLGPDAGYFMVDNVAVYAPDAYNTVAYDADHLLYIEQNSTKNLYGTTFYTSFDTDLTPVYLDDYAYRNMIKTEALNSIRLTEQSGLRFATLVDTALLDQLYALMDNGTVAKVTHGTLIAPADYIQTDFTTKAFKEEGKLYLEVQAIRDAYLTVDSDADTTHFAGSIVNILSHNVTRNFAGRGYVKITHPRGNDLTIYSDYTQIDNVKEVAIRSLALDIKYTTEQLEILNTFANGGTTGVAYEELYGLNVLAIGDSLFDGHSLTSDQTWLGLTAKNFGWNFTNLGRDGWTVASTAFSNVSGNRGSIYDALMTGGNLKSDAGGFDYTSWSGYQYGTTNVGASRYYNYGSPQTVANTEVDLILLEGGTNDFGYKSGIALGDINSTDPKTVYGAWNGIVPKLHEMYPNAKIVFVTAWHQTSNQTRMNYNVNCLKALAAKWNAVEGYDVACIDAGDPAISGINMMNADFRAQYSLDTYSEANHLNAAGMQIMAEAMKSQLWNTLFGAN